MALRGSVVDSFRLNFRRGRFIESHPSVPAISGTADAMPSGDGSADVIACGRAFQRVVDKPLFDAMDQRYATTKFQS
jgi:hypothetical protein